MCFQLDRNLEVHFVHLSQPTWHLLAIAQLFTPLRGTAFFLAINFEGPYTSTLLVFTSGATTNNCTTNCAYGTSDYIIARDRISYTLLVFADGAQVFSPFEGRYCAYCTSVWSRIPMLWFAVGYSWMFVCESRNNITNAMTIG